MRKMIIPTRFQGVKTSVIEITEDGNGTVTSYNVMEFQWEFNHERRIIEWKQPTETHWHEWGRTKEEMLDLYEYISIWIVEDQIFGE